MELCRELHRENGIFSMDEEKVRAMLRKAFDRQGGLLGVIGEPGEIEGMIFMLLSTFWYSSDPHWEEMLAFVRQKYRKSRNAVELVNFGKWCADSSGIPLVIGIISNERTAGKVRLYQRLLDHPIGNFFMYKADTSAISKGAA